MSQSTVEINENLVKIDNLITGLEYLLEEIQTRKDNILTDINFTQIVKDEINTENFRTVLTSYITDGYCGDLYEAIAHRVMARIDEDIAAFINDRVDQRLRELGIAPNPYV